MGLDVYLYHCPDRAKAKAAEEEYARLSTAEWEKVGGYSAATKEQKEQVEAAKEAHAAVLECTGEYESHATVTKIEVDSSIDHTHMFKIGYLRSSYNDGGINQVLTDIGVEDLYDIFQPADRYEFVPDWQSCLVRCSHAIESYEACLNSTAGKIGIMKVRSNIFTNRSELPQSAYDALQVAIREYEKVKGRTDDNFGGNGYSNREGEWFIKKPFKAIGFIPGVDNVLGSNQCVYVAYEKETDSEDEGKDDWYLRALKITREMIEYVLAKPDPENYYVHWSS